MDQVDFWREVRCSLKMLDALVGKERMPPPSKELSSDDGGAQDPAPNVDGPGKGRWGPAAARSEEIHAALMTFIRAIEKEYPELAPPRPRSRRKSPGADGACP